jgi:hypothetical protein
VPCYYPENRRIVSSIGRSNFLSYHANLPCQYQWKKQGEVLTSIAADIKRENGPLEALPDAPPACTTNGRSRRRLTSIVTIERTGPLATPSPDAPLLPVILPKEEQEKADQYRHALLPKLTKGRNRERVDLRRQYQE